MTDSNDQTTGSPTPTQAPAPAAAPSPLTGSPQGTQPSPAPQKTFTERFFELEQFANNVSDMMRKMLSASAGLENKVGKLQSDLEGTIDSMGAMINLLKEKAEISEEAIINRLIEEKAKVVQSNVVQAVEKKMIAESDVVKNEETMIAYKVEGATKYAYNKISNLAASIKAELLGKVKGDVVKGLEILGVYEAVKPAAPAPEIPATPQAPPQAT
jgi:hypothetical protein